MITIGPVIDGKELSDGGGGSVEVVNPATGQVVAAQNCCDAACVDRIVQASQAAFESAAWQGLTPADRGNLLFRLADVIEAHADELIELELIDTGKPVSQLRAGELPLCTAIIRFFAGAADKIEGAVKTTEGGQFLMTMYEPYGVVAGITPWNYPLANIALKVPPALAAGNTIVIKPSVETPLSTVLFAKLCVEAGIPPNIVNVVLGSGGKAGSDLVAHSLVKKISFTGSTPVGIGVQKVAAEQMKKVNLECGGKNAIIVFEDADLERAAQATLLSEFINAGQLCVSCSRLLVHESVADRFVGMLKEKAAKVVTGDPRDEATLVGPMITKSQYEVALGYLDLAPGEGCETVCGGGRLDLGGELAGGYWIEPTILTGVKVGMRTHDEEIFGPVLTVTTFSDEAEAIAISNSVEYGLSGSVWTTDGERSLRMIKALDTGIIWVNNMLTGYPHISVPPHKMSGTGVELGTEGLMAFCKQKSAAINYDSDAPVGWGL